MLVDYGKFFLLGLKFGGGSHGPSCKNNANNGYISTGAGNISKKPNSVVIPFCKKLDVCILNWYVEAYHDWVSYDEDITCAVGYIPIVGIVFT